MWLVISDLYLFHLTVLLNPVLNCSKSFLSFSVDKVTTGTYNFVSLILNNEFVGAFIQSIELSPATASLHVLLVIAQFPDHVKIRSISQLINGMTNALQKLLKFFNDTTISTSFSVLLPSNFAVILAL